MLPGGANIRDFFRAAFLRFVGGRRLLRQVLPKLSNESSFGPFRFF